jgi:hypothetical protein
MILKEEMDHPKVQVEHAAMGKVSWKKFLPKGGKSGI